MTKPGDTVAVQIPNDVHARIVASLKRNGTPNPTSKQIADTYLQNKGKPGFWQ